MAEREWVYLKRRRRISLVCNNFLRRSSPRAPRHPLRSLLYDGVHGLAYCPIPKAASSFWTLTMARLDPAKVNVSGYKEAHVVAPNKIGLPLTEVKNFTSLLSFAVVRHPFERLASVYFNKMIGMGHQVGWKRDWTRARNPRLQFKKMNK